MSARITTTLTLSLALLFGFGCDTEDDVETGAAEFEASPNEDADADAKVDAEFTLAADFEPDPEQLAEHAWSEAPLNPEQIAEIGEITPPPEKGTCGGYWDYTYVIGECGSCMHTVPEPDREGKTSRWYKRWCWTGGWGCNSCEPWQATTTICLDNCE